jgi:PGDYG protein
MNTSPGVAPGLLAWEEAQALFASDPACRSAHKPSTQVPVRFAAEAFTIQTLEGPVAAQPGDAVLTGVRGETWPVARLRFEAKYQPLPPLRMGQDGLYQSVPRTVRAWLMPQALRVEINARRDTLLGQAGDWLIDYQDGSLGVVAAEIFAATYALE